MEKLFQVGVKLCSNQGTFSIFLVGFQNCYEPLISVYSYCPCPFGAGMSTMVIVCLSRHCMLSGEQRTCLYFIRLQIKRTVLEECIIFKKHHPHLDLIYMRFWTLSWWDFAGGFGRGWMCFALGEMWIIGGQRTDCGSQLSVWPQWFLPPGIHSLM